MNKVPTYAVKRALCHCHPENEPCTCYPWHLYRDGMIVAHGTSNDLQMIADDFLQLFISEEKALSALGMIALILSVPFTEPRHISAQVSEKLSKMERRKERDADLIRRLTVCLSVRDRCRLLGHQDCFNCPRLECCDNISPEAQAAKTRSEKNWALANSRED